MLNVLSTDEEERVEGEPGRESAGAAAGGTLGLAEIIAVMDWSYSPEHGAPAPATTQQDDFADLRVMEELCHHLQLLIQLLCWEGSSSPLRANTVIWEN